VSYEYDKRLSVRLTIGKDNVLQECKVEFEIWQEYNAGGKGERVKMGTLSVNLAEYVESSDLQSPTSPTDNDESNMGVVRRYLMQNSKINSTLKVGIHMRHMEGTREYYAPSLRSAPVFGGIAGIMSSAEPVSGPANLGMEPDAPDNSVSQLSRANKENGEMQDMYRRTLAAFWASQPGELKADECIEDIFSGGDGWGKHGRPEVVDYPTAKHGGLENASRPGSGTTTPNPDTNQSTGSTRPKSSHSARKALGMSSGRHKHAHNRGAPKKGMLEIDEFEVREDLKSWSVSDKAHQ